MPGLGSVFHLLGYVVTSFPYTPHIPINASKVNNFGRKVGAVRRNMEMAGVVNGGRNIHRRSKGRICAAGMPERPSWLSFGLPGSDPGATKCAHLCCL